MGQYNKSNAKTIFIPHTYRTFFLKWDMKKNKLKQSIFPTLTGLSSWNGTWKKNKLKQSIFPTLTGLLVPFVINHPKSSGYFMAQNACPRSIFLMNLWPCVKVKVIQTGIKIASYQVWKKLVHQHLNAGQYSRFVVVVALLIKSLEQSSLPRTSILMSKFGVGFNKLRDCGSMLNFIKLNDKICKKISVEVCHFSYNCDLVWRPWPQTSIKFSGLYQHTGLKETNL